MALMRAQIEFALGRPENKDFQRQGSTDDLFDSFVNPESFHLTDSEVERKHSNDFTHFFDTQASSSGSDSFDILPMPELDPYSWQTSALSFDQEDASHARYGRHFSIHSASNGRAAASETDLLEYALPTIEPINDCPAPPATAPSTPRWRSRTRKPLDSPLSVRKRHCSASPHKGAKIDKSLRKVTVVQKMRSFSPRKPSSGAALLNRRFQDMTATGEFDLKPALSCYSLQTPPPSTQLPSSSFRYDQPEDMAVRSPSAFHDDFEPPLSPLSNGYTQFQHLNIPVVGPTFASRLTNSRLSSRETAEPQPVHTQMSSYPSSPLDTHPETFSLTPPATEPMNNAPWIAQPSFMHFASQASQSSPDIAGSDKAEHWNFPSGVDPSESTCGAPASFGLGITCQDQNHPRGHRMHNNHGMDFEHLDPMVMHHSSTPRNQQRTRPISADFPASALSYNPLPPQLDSSSQYSPYTTQRLEVQTYSASPARMQNYRPHHQRSHTLAAPISSVAPSFLSRDPHASYTQSFPPPPPSPSPPPRRHKRSSSMHHRRKSSSAQPVGFVNFTPSDSRKILTGVAPSGSSKTKARREKEAAEKRRKLSEAAKRAVLEAGGDLGALEREVLALNDI